MEINTEAIQLPNFTDLLSGRKILPIAKPIWKHTAICHGPGCKDHYQVGDYRNIRAQFHELNKMAGLYAYYVEDHCIYIGVSKDLRERVYQHLLESCDIWGHPKYKEAFSKYPGLIDFYYLLLGDQSRKGDYLRSIVEKILQVYCEPELKSIKI